MSRSARFEVPIILFLMQASLVGGSHPQPGEISLAHNGVLFFDELTEFKRPVLEILRQPLEEKTIMIAQAQQALSFPASFLLVAALNPCPCGFMADKKRSCSCTTLQVARYRSQLSGPLLDRIDLQVTISSIDYQAIADQSEPTSSQTLYEGVKRAYEMQQKRSQKPNALLSCALIRKFCTMSMEAENLIKKVFDRFQLTMRGYHKLIKLEESLGIWKDLT